MSTKADNSTHTEYLPRIAIEMATYRRMLREYRQFMVCLGLDPVAIESILSAAVQGSTIHRRELLRCIRVELDPVKLERAGFRGAVAVDAHEWFESIRGTGT